VPDLFEYAERRERARRGSEPAPAAQEAEATPEGTPPQAVPEPGSREAPLSVAQVVRGARLAVEGALGTVWVEGEIASLSRAASGHLYFVLGDGEAEARAVMWRSDASKLKFRVDVGQAVRCRARATIYEQGGKFQLYVSAIEPAGLGAEALALEQLKAKLAAEGLFAVERKRPLPTLPRRIGVVTSKAGAAVRDIIRATQRRFPVPLLIADALVQGESAPASLVRALEAIARCDVDVVIIGRGGGSSSDLAAFNDEAVVRAVAACPVPVISAVGHEVDVSLCDLAADCRAATPTMAGEMAVPVLAELSEALAKEERRLQRELAMRIAAARHLLDRGLDRAHGAISTQLHGRRRRLADARRELDTRHPRAQLAVHRAALRELQERAALATRRGLERRGRALAESAGRLSALSPLSVLERGYALATAGDRVVTDAAQVRAGDRIDLRLARGSLRCDVRSVHPPTVEE